jgi:hypothetical protein
MENATEKPIWRQIESGSKVYCMRGEVTPTLAGRDSENDNSAAGSNPAPPIHSTRWNQWRVTAISGRTRKFIAETFVRASDEMTAKSIAHIVFKSWRLGRVELRAGHYYPWLDRAFRGFIGEVKG